jgi:hypothetical protein
MDIPIYVTASIIGVSGFAALGVPTVLARATRAADLRPWTTATIGAALGSSLVATTLVAIDGAYRPTDGEVIPGIGVALVLALAGLGIAVATLPRFRAVLAHPDLQSSLLALQVWRIEGLAFLVLMALGQLPALFAVPAGLGDLAIGLSAPLMARNLHRRGLAIAWNVFGLADLALAILLGVTASPGPTQLFFTTPTAAAMTAFPMALIPTFLVPLSIGLHLISLRFLLSTEPRARARARQQLQRPQSRRRDRSEPG